MSATPGRSPNPPRVSATLVQGVRSLLVFAAPARGRLVAAVLLAVVATGLEVAPLVVLYVAIARLLDGTATATVLAGLAGAAFGCTVLRFALWGVAGSLSHLAAYDMLAQVRLRLARQLARLPLGALDGQRSGEVKKVMAEDAERLELFLAHTIPDLVSALAVWLGLSVWLAIVDWRMALVTAAVVPVAFWALRRSVVQRASLLSAVMTSERRMNGAIVELLTALPVVKVFGQQHNQVAGVGEAVDTYAMAQTQMTTAYLRLGTAFSVLIVANVVAILAVGLPLHLSGSLRVDTLLLFLLVGFGYSKSLDRAYFHAVRFSMMTAARTVQGLLDQAILPDTGTWCELQDASVEFRGVDLAYGDRTVLHDISFRAEPGSLVALVGPSGAGKTTLTRLISRALDSDAGQVLVGGVDVRTMAVAQLMATVATVFQDTFLFQDTLEGNIRVGRPDASPDQVAAVVRAAQLDPVVARLPDGLATSLGERGTGLSGGERQRVGIARALLLDAPVLVLDEATSFADPDNEALVQEAIGRLSVRRTVVVIAHRLSTVVGADQILVLDRGRIVERGTHPQLLDTGGLYARLWADAQAAQGIRLGQALHGDGGADVD